jgi:hypothetical protein
VQVPDKDDFIAIGKASVKIGEGCEQALENPGRRCAVLIHRYLDSNLRFYNYCFRKELLADMSPIRLYPAVFATLTSAEMFQKLQS